MVFRQYNGWYRVVSRLRSLSPKAEIQYLDKMCYNSTALYGTPVAPHLRDGSSVLLTKTVTIYTVTVNQGWRCLPPAGCLAQLSGLPTSMFRSSSVGQWMNETIASKHWSKHYSIESDIKALNLALKHWIRHQSVTSGFKSLLGH